MMWGCIIKILLLEPYCGGSHQAWAEGYAAHSRHDVRLLALPARFWKWRMQGGVVTLAEQARALAFRPDLILASDMLNLPVFLGLTRDFLSHVPAVLYCHENQLTYPLPPSSPLAGEKEGGEKRDLTYGMINWLSMLAASRVFFNSRYHLEDWFEELPRLLEHLPDYTHVHRIAEVRARAEVLPVGCDLRRFDTLVPSSSGGEEEGGTPPLILWNQRWEYDKNPETFFRALYTLAEEGMDFRVALAGKNARQTAPEFEAARERLGARVVHFGYADETANPSGRYLAPPFGYNTCVDRDGDGLLKTSRGLRDTRPWPSGTDVVGGTDGIVEDADDECILIYQRLPIDDTIDEASMIRHVSVDASNNVWVGDAFTAEPSFHLLDGNTGAILASLDKEMMGCGGYGGLVDGNGILWSASREPVLRYDPATGIGTCMDVRDSYGLG